MKYKLLGKSNLKVSQISMGGMSLSNQPSEISIIHEAIERGINFFDTADLYDKGKNETFLGNALKGKRDKVILATKVGNQWNEDGKGWSWNPTKEYILQAVDESLKRLQTDYIDLYQLHGGTIEDPIDETIEAFEILKEKGKIRAYGISSIRPNVIRTYSEKSNIASVMMQYSLLDRRPEETCLELLGQNNISVITRGTLAKGLLAGKPSRDYLEHHQQDVLKAAQSIEAIAKHKQLTPAQLACLYVLSSNTVASAVVGIRTLDQLLNVLPNEDFGEINDVEVDKLQNSISALTYKKHC